MLRAKKPKPQYPEVFHAVFQHGLIMDRQSELLVCLFDGCTAMRTVLSSCVIRFASRREATASERKIIKSWKLAASFKAKLFTNRPDSGKAVDPAPVSDPDAVDANPELEIAI